MPPSFKSEVRLTRLAYPDRRCIVCRIHYPAAHRAMDVAHLYSLPAGTLLPKGANFAMQSTVDFGIHLPVCRFPSDETAQG